MAKDISNVLQPGKYLEISGDPEKLIVSYFQGISVAEYFYNI
jgi:hypothetical protein